MKNVRNVTQQSTLRRSVRRRGKEEKSAHSLKILKYVKSRACASKRKKKKEKGTRILLKFFVQVWESERANHLNHLVLNQYDEVPVSCACQRSSSGLIFPSF